MAEPIGTDWETHAPAIAVALLGEPAERRGDEWRWRGEGGGKRSLAVNVRKAVWRDHSLELGGHLSLLIERVLGVDWKGRNEWLVAGGFREPWRPGRRRPTAAGRARAAAVAEQRREERERAAAARQAADVADASRRVWRAANAWDRAIAADPGTPAHTYLCGRGVWPSFEPLPPSVRWRCGAEDLFVRGEDGVLRPLEGAAGIVLWVLEDAVTRNGSAVGVEALDAAGKTTSPRLRETWGVRSGAWFVPVPLSEPSGLVLVEGAVDALAVAAALSGRGLAVAATDGAAMTDALVEAVGALSIPVVLLADGDTPGVRGAHGNADRLRGAGAHVVVQSCAWGEDPASCIAGWIGEALALGQDEPAAWALIRERWQPYEAGFGELPDPRAV